jgi:hypothetical protein
MMPDRTNPPSRTRPARAADSISNGSNRAKISVQKLSGRWAFEYANSARKSNKARICTVWRSLLHNWALNYNPP